MWAGPYGQSSAMKKDVLKGMLFPSDFQNNI